jgi:hybrid polyketide synthase / nonribosomal peptide synthetase ACE1
VISLTKLHSQRLWLTLDSFPPIAGIAHGAMVLDDASFFDMPFEKMQKVLRPKVQGAIFLDELFQDDSLDFFIFFSSVASIVGNRGQSAYSASNMFMVALAAQRRRKGLAAFILHIGAVLGVGYVTREFADTPFVHIGKAGFMWMSERGFHLRFGEAVLASHPISGCNPEIITGMNTMSVGEGINSPWTKFPRF